VSELITESRPLDKRPFFWMLGILCLIAAGVLVFEFIGQQRLHNTALWRHFRPVTLVSPPQTGTPVEVIDTRRVAHVVVQTEKGLYFLTGAQIRAGSRIEGGGAGQRALGPLFSAPRTAAAA
jgi:hypothetical protein